MVKKLGNFRLEIEKGSFTDSEIIVMLGENGTGKTTLVKILAGLMDPDNLDEVKDDIMQFKVSYKPQKISPKFEGTVKSLLDLKVREMYTHP